MIVAPKSKGFICTTAHPVGCKENVRRQIAYAKSQKKVEGPKKVLVIGASTGYGLASRIAAAYTSGAATLGIMFEKESNGKRTATAGWYNTKAFEEIAKEDGLYAKTVNGDAFSQEVKDQVIQMIKEDFGKVDMVVYSLAAPRRTDKDGTLYNSVLKTVGEEYTNNTWNLGTDEVEPAHITPATEDEIKATIKVMGGEDWADWIKALKDADVIEDHAITLAYSYIGPDITHAIYKDGSIGQAKKHLYNTACEITKQYADSDIKAYISVNKALVTQSSSAIPIVPLYISLLYKVMKDANLHEGCIEQMCRLFTDKLFDGEVKVDAEGMIRLDDWEMKEEIQKKVQETWAVVNTDNLKELADCNGYWDDFFQMFGFRIDGVDYDADVEI